MVKEIIKRIIKGPIKDTIKVYRGEYLPAPADSNNTSAHPEPKS